MASKKTQTDRLAVRYLDDELLLSATHAWTYVRVPLVAFEFLSSAAKEGLAAQVTLALAGLVTSVTESVECHLRIVHRPLDAGLWRDLLGDKVAPQGPTEGWAAYLDQMANRVDRLTFEEKEVYLGVCLGDLKSRGSVTDLLDPVKFVSSFVEQKSGFTDDVVSAEVLKFWKAKAANVQRSLNVSHLKAAPATAAEVAWVIARPMWPEMVAPDVSSNKKAVWGPGEVRSLAEGFVTHNRKSIEVEQELLTGEKVTGFQIGLALSRFPDRLEFPGLEPWIHLAAAFPFPVDFSTRMKLVPTLTVMKDVGKKLADAKDQAQHIADAGAGVPLRVQEQLLVAESLQYSMDKDRTPWAYARHHLFVTGPTLKVATDRARTVVEKYKELGIDVVWPTGDQMDMLLESTPGDTGRTTSYLQRQELAVMGGGMPTASAEVGDGGAKGCYIGYTTERVHSPVFFSPNAAMGRNGAPGVAITGAPGGGKSFFAFTLAYQMALQGVWTIYIDPKADAKPMGLLPGLGNARVFDLRQGNDGMLDPFSLGESIAESTMLALETLRLLLGGTISEEREQVLMGAVKLVARQPQPSLSKVVDVLLANQLPASQNLGGVLELLQDLPFARLCFAATGGHRLRPEDGLTVVTLLGLNLPAADMSAADYSYENRLAVSVMYLLSSYAKGLMLSLDKNHPKAICIDEAWAITSTPQGAKLIPEVARMGRSHNTALVLVSQNAGDLSSDAVANSLSSKFAFRPTIPKEHDDVLKLMGLPADQGFQSSVRDLRNGECLFQDFDGRVSRIQIDSWNKTLFDAFDTNPETRGKANKENGSN